MKRCSWCNTDPEEAAARHEGPHATWCPRFSEEQRGGAKIALVSDVPVRYEILSHDGGETWVEGDDAG